jgi:hypothetical protein
MSPLRRRMIDDMQIRNLTPNTQRVGPVRRMAASQTPTTWWCGPVPGNAGMLPAKSSTISGAILTVSQFPTTAWYPWTTVRFVSAGRIIGTTTARRR